MSAPTADRLNDGTIVLDSPVVLPDVLDLLIVGGGPVGTACAFHATELGIRTLVIDSDDLMKRIRDYAKDKPILPDYGGGDTMQFPAGGDLVSALRFDPIDKDEMVALWKGFYRKFSVPAKIGVELLSLAREGEGIWRAEARNHYTKQNETYRARNIVLGLGRGVPRRLDIPGNAQDLAVRLTDAAHFVGAPACVIGGGTSAAEAAIAISNAKTASETDDTPVYWSYRGKFLPKVSQALAPELFEVFMMNGNLRLVLGSDPVAVVPRDGKEYLAICTKVSEGPGQPREIVQLEFEKGFCVACIGADRPDPLLKEVGAEFVPKESADGDRLVVSQLLETRQPGVFLAGDLLSPDYAETDNFDGDPSAFTVRSRRGNIKSALRDGVLLAQVVKQRLEGRQQISVAIAPAPPLAPAANKRSGPAAEKPRSPGRLVALLADNTPADEFPLVWEGVTTIGRGNATISFPQDSMLSDQHASIAHGPAGLELSDLGSEHGVFLKVPEGRTVQLPSGTIVKAGRQWLVARESPSGPEVVQWDNQGSQVGRYPIPDGTTIVFGRRPPAKVLSADDQTLGRQHLSLSTESGRLLLRDLNSRNGTFVKVERRWKLQDGDLIWLGNQMLRVAIGEGQEAAAMVVTGAVRAAPPPPSIAPPSVPQPAPGPSGEAAVTFTPPGKSFPIVKGKTMLDLAIAKRVRLKWECKVGDCGKCWVKITAGGEHLNSRSGQEDKTLRMISHDQPQCRLACLVTEVRGPVAAEVPK